MEIIENHSFQHCHSLKVELFKIIQDHHTISNGIASKISTFKVTTPSQSENGKKSIFSIILHSPKLKMIKISHFRGPQLAKVETVQKQTFQDHHTLPKKYYP